ncbi:Oidioi.mRNA.OKI2018_I69.PAR.g13167.t1.cds [Oikopleura dioica]|uniref:Oidioi.mRNA.OKI2018_I69.PAR.g13167.t1.cds n=1 Tax=Oikopleura dioica TaxID=34765 RepID=A0ABN7S3E1_OIKDI|nr:Oidioi.mRNA.OKI2018_I69.PAR.g13167.t1.cds [Oikopleura dioica]
MIFKKLFSISSLFLVAKATHFRAGSLQFKKDENGVLRVTRTVGWRRYLAGWGSNGCDDDDMGKLNPKKIANGRDGHKNYYMPLGETDVQTSWLANPKTVYYELLQIEKSSSLTNDEHFCFGKTFDEELPSQVVGKSFTMTNGYVWEAATVTITHDNGNNGQGYYQYTAHVYEYDNNSPQFENPAIWWIMDGCDGQTYYITPQDPDGDEIICRWSTKEEASFLANDKEGMDVGGTTHWPMTQLTLDTAACAVTYHPEEDNGGGNKPIAVQVEDFDENGGIKSSVPSVFLARVFTPDMDRRLLDAPFTVTNRRKRDTGEHHHEEEIKAWNDWKPNIRLQPRNTDHCDGLPVWIPPTPPNESLLIYQATVSYYQVWAARFLFEGEYYTTVHRAQFSLPDGMSCTKLREDGTATCIWTPTVEQIGLHTVCGLCYDVFERPSERNCVKIEVIYPEAPVENPCNTTAIITKEKMKAYEFNGQNIIKAS